jgi:hypothetical protein
MAKKPPHNLDQMPFLYLIHYALTLANITNYLMSKSLFTQDITENDQLSRSAECREINTVLEEMKLKIRQLVPLMMPQITGPPPAGCFPRFGQSPQFHHKMGGGGNGEKSNSSEEKKH